MEKSPGIGTEDDSESDSIGLGVIVGLSVVIAVLLVTVVITVLALVVIVIRLEKYVNINHPGLAEIFAPDGVSRSDIIENFRQWEDNSWVQDGSKSRCKIGSHNMFTKISK